MDDIKKLNEIYSRFIEEVSEILKLRDDYKFEEIYRKKYGDFFMNL